MNVYKMYIILYYIIDNNYAVANKGQLQITANYRIGFRVV